jgi:putative hydrolases of HD superfamily
MRSHAERVVAMLLVHDIGEIDAGDKFVFAQDGWEERKAAELRAVERGDKSALMKQ